MAPLLLQRLETPAWCVAMGSGDGWLARAALERGEAPTDCGWSYDPLRAFIGDPGVVEALLDRGAAPTPCALVAAAEAGLAGSVRALLDHGADPRDTSCGWPLATWHREPAAALLDAGLDPFGPDAPVHGLWTRPWVDLLIAAETAWPEVREERLVYTWLRGQGYDLPLVQRHLPEGWASIPGGTLPELPYDAFHAAWVAAGGANGLRRARLGAGFGPPVTLPCPIPRTRADAEPLTGKLRRDRANRDYVRWEGPTGDLVVGRDGHGSLSYDLARCPALYERRELAPVVVGPRGAKTPDGTRVWVEEWAAYPSGWRLAVSWDGP